ncbi:MAG: WD40 repeat domain-containing serine/threonine protein kinase, partial [Planctomycetota bacterium]
MDSAQVVARFEAERQALALLDHPNIAQVHDAGTTETGRPYFVMEYVKGSPITEYCDRHKLSIEDRLSLFQQVCHAVQHAHQKGIIHRDIKPSNVLVSTEGDIAIPKIIDFGVAKAIGQPLTERTLFTEDTQLLGTPEYMSPEQAEMVNEDIDTRSDIYSLGVLLYELLTGVLPFDAQSLRAGGPDHIRRTLREEDPKTPSTRLSTISAEESVRVALFRQTDVRTLNRRLHGDLDWITLKAMEKDRTRRYTSVGEFVADITRHLNNEPVLAGPPSTTYRLQKFVRRNRAVLAGLTAVVTALMIGLTISAIALVREQRARRFAVVAQEQEAKLRREAEADKLAVRQTAYASDMNLAQQALAMNNLGRAQDLLSRHRPKPGEMDLRGWEWRYLWKQCQSDALFTLCKRSRSIWSLAVSHDAEWLAVGEDEGGGLSVWDLAERQEIARLAAGDGSVRVVFSPCEPLLAFSVVTGFQTPSPQHSIRLWNGKTRQIVAQFAPDGECMGLAFSNDGQILITYAGDPANQITLWRVPTASKLASYPVSAFDQMETIAGTHFAMARDMSVAAVAPDDMIHVIDLSTGEERWAAQAADESVKALAMSSDGMIMASGAGFSESAIRLWDAAAGREITRLQSHRAWVGALAFWPDGKTLASASADQTIRLWDLTDVTNVPPPRVLRGHSLEVWRLALLPDSRTVVSGCKDGSVCLWDTARIQHEQMPIILPAKVATWQFAPDHKSVLVQDSEGH